MIGCREVGVLFRNCEVSGRPTTKCGYMGRSQPPSEGNTFSSLQDKVRFHRVWFARGRISSRGVGFKDPLGGG